MTAPETTPQLGDTELSPAERKLLHAAAISELVNLCVDDDELDDPAQGARLGTDRTDPRCLVASKRRERAHWQSTLG